MPGTSPRLLHDGNSYLRQQRIYEASRIFHNSSVRRPWYPDLNQNVWVMCDNHFKGTIEATRAQLQDLPRVFTKRQMYIAVAILWLWDIQGTHAHFTYDMLEEIIPHVAIGGKHLTGTPSRHTIAQVLYMFSDTGAAKYIKGFPGVKSQLVLADLAMLSTLPSRTVASSQGTQECSFSWPSVPTHVPMLIPRTRHHVPTSRGTQECSFGYEHLLEHLYNQGPRTPEGRIARGWRGKVTRTFNQELIKQGLRGRIDYEAHPKFKYLLQTWRVTVPRDDDWKVQVAVYATRDRLRAS